VSAHDWELAAACRLPGADPDAWYPTIGQTGDAAKTICWTACPVRTTCLEAALAEEHRANPRRVKRWGIRGGMSPDERAGIQFRRSIRSTTAARAATPIPTD
jgi:hypothetical protein